MKKIILCVFALVASFQLAAQTPATKPINLRYQQAIAAYQKQDFQAAFQLLEPMAKAGDKTAQHNLAVLYQDGLGTKQDDKKALYWYEQAAKQGEAEAQFMAGLMYSDGIGTKQNYEKAVYWYQKAAAQNHVDAQNNLAVRYATGSGIAKNMAEAKKWYRRAAEQGNQQSAFTLQQLELLEMKDKAASAAK
ncbi:tetratricopeptide repeat protein [Neisseriaceae bacterium B1]